MNKSERAQHTPGPWVAVIDPMVGGCRDITTVEGGLLAATAGISNDEMDEANARLLATAPELLEALEICVRGLRDVQANSNLGEFRKKAEAAICKAERCKSMNKSEISESLNDDLEVFLKKVICNGANRVYLERVGRELLTRLVKGESMKNADQFLTEQLADAAPQHSHPDCSETIGYSDCDRCTMLAMMRLYAREN